MTKINLIALNVIHMTITPGQPGDRSRGISPIPPVIKVLKPGTLFSVDATEKAFYTEGTKPAARLAKSQAEPPVSREELNRAKAAVGATSESLVTPDDDETEDADEEAARVAAEEEAAAQAKAAAQVKATADKKEAAAKKAAEKPKAKPGPKAKAASGDAGDDLV